MGLFKPGAEGTIALIGRMSLAIPTLPAPDSIFQSYPML
jgi:hypothetical protein